MGTAIKGISGSFEIGQCLTLIVQEAVIYRYLLNSNCLGAFLEQFSSEYSQEIHIIQLDNAPVHTAKKLIIPENIILLFQPPYCPELNPIERVWQYIKQQLKNLFFMSIDDVKDKVAHILNFLSEDVLHSLTGWKYILDALSL